MVRTLRIHSALRLLGGTVRRTMYVRRRPMVAPIPHKIFQPIQPSNATSCCSTLGTLRYAIMIATLNVISITTANMPPTEKTTCSVIRAISTGGTDVVDRFTSGEWLGRKAPVSPLVTAQTIIASTIKARTAIAERAQGGSSAPNQVSIIVTSSNRKSQANLSFVLRVAT